ncbi:MAG: hypothetical protein CME59_10140 [Halioglobus sp.]|nr:hypothetical protein [Halioglobus sp.]
MRAVAALLVLLAGCASALADEPRAQEGPADAVVARLSAQVAVRGRFEQTRQLPGADNVLRASGEFIFWRGHGVHWATETPLQRVLVYRHDATLLAGVDGSSPQTVGGAAQRQFRDVLLTVFSFDRDRLEARFRPLWRFEGEAWTLTLEPRQKSLRRHLDRVEMWGAETLRGLRIHGRELLTLEFHDSATLPGVDAITCEEAFLYAAASCAEAYGDNAP